MPTGTKVEPSELFAKIDACPPLMREQAKAMYLGKEVDWILNLVNGWAERSEHARLALRQERSNVQFVIATVPLSDCPWLRHVHTGERLRIRGRIADIDGMSIELEGTSVSQLIEAAP